MVKFPGNTSKQNPVRAKRLEITEQQAAQAMIGHVMKNADDYADLKCGMCRGMYFDNATRLKRVSQFDPVNLSRVEQVINFGVWICRECGKEAIFSGPSANTLAVMPEKQSKPPAADNGGEVVLEPIEGPGE